MSSDRQKMRLLRGETLQATVHVAKAQTVSLSKITEKIDLVWNPNGTLNKITMDDVCYGFVWTQNNSLARITKRQK